MNRIFAGVLLLLLSLDVFAQTSCGFIRCEEYIIPNPSYHGSYYLNKRCQLATSGSQPRKVQYWYQNCALPANSCSAWADSGTSFAGCDCSAKPNWHPPGGPKAFASSIDPGGTNPHKCMAGCDFVPNGPFGVDPWLPGEVNHVITTSAGWKATGAQCNPVNPAPPEEPTLPQPNCDGTQCVERDPTFPPKPPKFCIEVNGKRICADPDDGPCAGDNAKGYLCLGNPPPDPPPPPETKPDPQNPSQPAPPAAQGGPSQWCNGDGACSSNHWEYTEGGASSGGGGDDPDDPDDPGTGPGGIGGPNVCPDGSAPQGGRCPAPVTCPGGTAPVNGRCPSATSCPVGTTPTGTAGQCAPTSGTTCPPGSTQVGNVCQGTVTCPNGATPDANNTCPGTVGTCPNGAQPVNGVCDISSACDPETDPNQCNGDGNAGGGQTCGAAPFCSGDPIMCQVLNQQWQTRCAVHEGLVGDGTPNADAIEAMEGAAAAGHEWGEEEVDLSGVSFDDSGYGLARTCPSIPPFVVLGHTIEIPPVWCWLLEMMGTLVLIGASWAATKIVANA